MFLNELEGSQKRGESTGYTQVIYQKIKLVDQNEKENLRDDCFGQNWEPNLKPKLGNA